MLGLDTCMVEDLQLEKCVGNLEHEDMRMAMVVHDQDTFYCSSHSKVFIVVLEALQTSRNRGILFRLGLFGAESWVVRSDITFS